jgi:Flp pilus assembly protein protease CpaA
MVSTLTLLVLTAIAAYTDATRHKIYNWTTYPGIIAGIVTQAWERGWDGAEQALIGFFACGFIMLACFVFFPDLGGGDVKLIAMLGAGLGWEDGILAMLWTFAIGFVAGLSVLIWKQGVVRVCLRALEVVRSALHGRVTPAGPEDAALNRWLFLAPAALAAVVIVRWDVLKGAL